MTARHGTPSGYNAHRAKGERPCDPCYQAKSDYDKRWRSAPDIARRKRLAARAQARAYGRLVNLFPEIYAVLYAEEKARLLAEEAP